MDSKKWSMWAQITIVLGIVLMVASEGGWGLGLLGIVFLIGGIVALIYGKVRGRERTV